LSLSSLELIADYCALIRMGKFLFRGDYIHKICSHHSFEQSLENLVFV
jgi:hypothetical protein